MAFERMEGAGKRLREEGRSSFLCSVSFVDPDVLARGLETQW